MRTSIIIMVPTKCKAAYSAEVTKAKNELKEYFGNRLTVEESMESQFPIFAINTEISETDIKNLDEMFPADRETKVLIITHTEDAMDSNVLYTV